MTRKISLENNTKVWPKAKPDTVNSSLLATTQGVEDEMNTMGKRIGDEINLTGVSIKNA